MKYKLEILFPAVGLHLATDIHCQILLISTLCDKRTEVVESMTLFILLATDTNRKLHFSFFSRM